MNFASLEFLCLLAATFGIYYFLARTGAQQVLVLVVASLVFYAWEDPRLLGLLLACATVATVVSAVLAGPRAPSHRRWLACGVVFLLAALGLFKYNALVDHTFFANGRPAGWVGTLLTLPLPIGISFYVFHAISLLVDTYTRAAPPSEHVGFLRRLRDTLLYIVFFPQLIAGPIVKARDFLPQIGAKRLAEVSFETVVRLLILGFFLKLVVADNLAVHTQRMTFPHFAGLPSSMLVMLLVAYSCQIFADFAGYSLIAIGIAALFGYRLPENFNRPYIATSFSDFWRRWHISLSTWLRDYLYKPLGGSHKGRARTYVNLMIVMFLGGLWHGAAWSYAAWGTIHGVALALERPFHDTAFMKSTRAPVLVLRALIVFSVVTFAWLMFRLPEFAQVVAYLKAIGTNTGSAARGRDLFELALYCTPVLVLHLWPWLAPRAQEKPGEFVYALLLLAVLLNSGVPGAFIYFQF